MKLLQKQYGKRHLLLLVMGLMGATFLLCGSAWGIDTPGLSLSMYGDASNPDLKFSQGEKVTLTMVLRNDTGFPLSTERGFSKFEPQRFLVLLDPAGAQHVVGGNVMSGNAPPPFFLGKKTTIPAETLPAGWVKSVVIDDLTELFPVMKNAFGWYTLEAHIPFIRMVWTIKDTKIGLLGVEDDRNWKGTLDANRMQIEIGLPPTERGALLKAQVLDQGTIPPDPISQVPVRVYEAQSIVGLTPAEAWDQGPGAATLVGTTDTDGWAVWDKNLCKTEKDYIAIAYYQNEYRAVQFAAGEDGWALQCEGQITRIIKFGEVLEKNILVTGAAYTYPEGDIHEASISMDVSTESNNPSGWLKFYYTRTRLFFTSTGITDITISQANASVKGTGAVNGADGFSFEALVTDSASDRFGFIIKDASGDTYHTTTVQDISGGDLFIIIKAMANKSIGDLDGDADADGKDMAAFVSAYGMGAANADMNNDEAVDAADIEYFAGQFGSISDSSEAGFAPPPAEQSAAQSAMVRTIAADDENIKIEDSEKKRKRKRRKKNKKKKN